MDEEERPTNTIDKPTIKVPDIPTRRTQDFGSLLPNSNDSRVPEVRKPDRQWLIRVHPTWKLRCVLFEDSIDQSIYLVRWYLKKDYPDVLQDKIIYAAITQRDKVLFFWHLSLGNMNNTYNRTAKEASELAKTTWIRVSSDKNSRTYKTYPGQNQTEEPQFPSDKELDELLLRAFEGKTIKDEDHPVLRRLRGLDP